MSSGQTGRNWESFVDRQIREAQERGEFDRLPGAGQPLRDLDAPRDPEWWIRRKLREENITRLPPALRLKREVERAREQIDHADSEGEVRAIVAAINTHIRYTNSTIVQGPPSAVMTLDEDDVVRRWRLRRLAEDDPRRPRPPACPGDA